MSSIFKKLVGNKSDKVKFDNIPKANEEYVSVSNGCIKFIDSYQFLKSSSVSLVKTLIDIIHKTLRNLEKTSWG